MSRSSLLALLLLSTAACAPTAKDERSASTPTPDQESAANRWMVQQMRDTAAVNAIVSQRTIYPYHFVPGTAELNELGQRDVGILAGSLTRQVGTGEISVRRGPASDELYHARVDAVRRVLSANGIAAERIKTTDSFAGGRGMPGDEVNKIMTRPVAPHEAALPEGSVEVPIKDVGR